MQAHEINDLFEQESPVGQLYVRLKELGIAVEREWWIDEAGAVYIVDLALPVKNGWLPVTFGDHPAHIRVRVFPGGTMDRPGRASHSHDKRQSLGSRFDHRASVRAGAERCASGSQPIDALLGGVITLHRNSLVQPHLCRDFDLADGPQSQAAADALWRLLRPGPRGEY